VTNLGFGAKVRQARLAHGWKQEELAKRVGMSQRAVSNWERGVAEPEDAVKDRVLEVLGLCDPAAAAAVRTEPTYPGRALVSELPFEWLSPDDFEEFIADLLAALYPRGIVGRVGKAGHAQGGYDVHVAESSGRLILGVQCKREARFGPKKVSDAVDEARKAASAAGAEPVELSVIALSRIASPDGRKEIRKHPGWELWDRNDLSRKVRGLELDRAIRIVKRFFPTMLADFLGVVRPGPWLTSEEYIDRWNTEKIYSHRWPLVGPPDTVDTLAGVVARGEGRVMLLTGPGGSGKTKALMEVCTRAADGGIAVRVLESDSDIEPDSFEQLPGTGALLVIVDDAHDEDVPLGRIIAGVLQKNPAANILVGLRPYGLAHVRQELRRVGHHADDAPEVKIPELDLESATQLAYQVLDEPVRHHGLRLAAAARDCPLLIVTGAALVNRGELDPAGFEDDQRLHVELTDRLAEALTAQSPAEGPARRDVLTALAAYQPFDLADGQARDSVEKLTGLDFERAAPHLSGLEDAGLVLRRGTVVRVVPDLLGDALLNQAARHRRTDLPTGYLEKALRSARGAAVRNLIVNAGRVDWQAGASGPDGAGLIEPLWQVLDAALRESDAIGRINTLELVAKVAFFQPRRSLDMARWAMANPAEPATGDIGFGYTRTSTDAEVRHALAPILRPVAWYRDLFPTATELLWDLVQTDQREPNQHPDHPERVLAELACFTRYGMTVQQRTLVGLVDRWLNRFQGTGVRSPLTVLGPLLAVSGHDEQWTPEALVFRSYPVLPTPEILQLRHSVLSIAFDQLTSADLTWAAAAITVIGAGITIPPPAFGLRIEGQIQQDWHAHFADVLDRLRERLAQIQLAPALLVALRDQLSWTAQHGPDQLRRAAQDIVADLPVTPDNTLARALHGGPIDPADNPDLDAVHQAHQQLFTGAITAISGWPDKQAAARISALLADNHRVFGSDPGRARPFLWDLISRRPSLGAAMCAHAMSFPDSTLGEQVSIVLIAMGQAHAPETIEWARQLLGDGRIEFARQVAHAFGLQRSRTDLLPGEADLLRTLAGHTDHVVAAASAGAARYLTTAYPELALELTFTALPTGGLRETAGLFGPQPNGTLTWSQLPAQNKSAILGQLTECPTLDDYEIGQFLAHIVTEEAGAVVEMLQRRVENVEQGSTSAVSALPLRPFVPLPFRQSARFPDLLRQLREWLAAAPQSWPRAHLGGDLFALVAGPFDDQVLDVVFDFTDTPDPAKMKVVATILRRVPRELVWNVEVVRRVLRAADRCGTNSLQAVQGALIGAASRGGRSTTPGQPFPEDVEQLDRAEALAASCLPGSVEEQFYQMLAESARNSIAWTTNDIDRPDDQRNWS
jgi:transcriptional regulator with XRE-family HTH domain